MELRRRKRAKEVTVSEAGDAAGALCGYGPTIQLALIDLQRNLARQRGWKMQHMFHGQSRGQYHVGHIFEKFECSTLQRASGEHVAFMESKKQR